MKTSRPDQCELCARAAPLTQHHLIPKRLHRNTKIRKQYGVDTLRTQIAWLCLPCHKHIHRCISERDLGLHYASVAQLRGHPEVAAFVDWLAQKPDDFAPRLSRRKRMT